MFGLVHFPIQLRPQVLETNILSEKHTGCVITSISLICEYIWHIIFLKALSIPKSDPDIWCNQSAKKTPEPQATKLLQSIVVFPNVHPTFVARYA